jgi:hypothetical protein
MQTIGITGGTGFVGRHLSGLLKDNGCEVVIFTTHPEKRHHGDGLTYSYWDPKRNKCDLSALGKLNAVIHLAGAGIADKRWTKKRKEEIVTSRTVGTRFMVNQLKQHAPNCKTFIAASAMGFYGPDRDSKPFNESSPAYDDFLGKTCVLWENESLAASENFRTVIFRFGIVMGKDDGAFKEMAAPLKFGIMPILGSGKQIISWIHVDDLSRLIWFALTHDKIEGVFNAVTPEPVSQRALMRSIADHKKLFRIPAPVPALALKLLFGEMAKEVLKSCTVDGSKILENGFEFKYPTIDKAVSAILASNGKHSR